jgi:phenylacetic acid degradation protein
MDDVEIGDECIIGALAFINANSKIPSRSLVVGNPAKIIKEVSDEMIAWKTKGTQLYQTLPADMMQAWEPCEALTKIPENRPAQETLFHTWNTIKKS